MLALLALLQPLVAIAYPEVNGWRPDHAHVQLAGAVPRPHAHPFDHAAPEHASSSDSVASSDGAGEAVGFVAPDADGGAAVLAAPAVLVVPEALPAEAATQRARPVDALVGTDPPPPRA